MTEPVSIIVLTWKPNGERYIFAIADGRNVEARQAFARFAADPELSFTWEDASDAAEALDMQESHYGW